MPIRLKLSQRRSRLLHGGVISITGNALESTDTSSSRWNKGTGIYFSNPRANGGPDNAITSVTLQNNTLKDFGGNAVALF